MVMMNYGKNNILNDYKCFNYYKYGEVVIKKNFYNFNGLSHICNTV